MLTSKFYIGVLVPAAVLIPMLVACCRYRHWHAPARMVLAYLVLSATFNLIARLTAHTNNLPYLHVYTVLEFGLLFAFFRSLMREPLARGLFLAGMLGFPLLAGLFLLTSGSLYTFNDVPRFVSSMLITVVSIFLLLKDISSVKNEFSMFLFLVLTGLLLYYATCSTLFIFSNKLPYLPKARATLFWNIHATFNLIMYLFMAIGFYKLERKDG